MSASTDPIADFLTRIRNAIQAAHETVDIPSSKLKNECARILAEQGYIDGFAKSTGRRHPGEIIRLRLSTRPTPLRSPARPSLRPGRRT